MKLRLVSTKELRILGPIRWQANGSGQRYAFGLWLWTLHIFNERNGD